MADVAYTLEPGALLAGLYRLDRNLGEGGMGVVWAAIHTITGRSVALKLLKHAGDAPKQRARLLREARAASAVRHPNVCEVYDVLELADGAPVIVMEHLAGEPLSERLHREGRLSVADLAGLFVPVVSAVGAAHALGIVHRDLKPDNIFLAEGPPPAVKVLDFGVAKLTASEGAAAATAELTDTGALVGTPYYMSPEQALGEKGIDGRADIWALGLIMYRCLSGVLPTAADKVGQVYKNIVLRPIRPIEQIAPDLPGDVAALVGRMLSRARRDRPSDLREVAAILARYTEVKAPEIDAAAPAPPRESAPDLAAGGRAPSFDVAAQAKLLETAGDTTTSTGVVNPLAETGAVAVETQPDAPGNVDLRTPEELPAAPVPRKR